MIVNALLFLFAASIPLTDVSRAYLGAGSLAEILLVALVGAWLWEQRKRPFTLTPGIVLLYLVFALGFLSWIASDLRDQWGASWIPSASLAREFEYLVVLVTVSQLSGSTQARSALLRGLIAGLGLTLLFVALQWGLGTDHTWFHQWGPMQVEAYTGTESRVWGSFGHPLSLVNFLVSMLGILIVLTVRSPGSLQRASLMLLLVGVIVGLLMTGSRIALLVMLVPMIYGVIAMPAVARRRIIIPVLLLLAAISLTNVAGVSLDRLADLGVNDPSVTQRLKVYEAALKMMADHPLLGVGPGEFASTYFERYLEEGADLDPVTFTPENIFLLAGAELGIPAMVLFVTALVAVVRMGYRLGRQVLNGADRIQAEAAALGTTCLIASSMIQTSSDAASRLLLYTMLGILLGLQAQHSEVSARREPSIRTQPSIGAV